MKHRVLIAHTYQSRLRPVILADVSEFNIGLHSIQICSKPLLRPQWFIGWWWHQLVPYRKILFLLMNTTKIKQIVKIKRKCLWSTVASVRDKMDPHKMCRNHRKRLRRRWARKKKDHNKKGPVFISSVMLVLFFVAVVVIVVVFFFFLVIIIILWERFHHSCFYQRGRRGNDGQYAPGFASSSPDFLRGQLPTKFPIINKQINRVRMNRSFKLVLG